MKRKLAAMLTAAMALCLAFALGATSAWAAGSTLAKGGTNADTAWSSKWQPGTTGTASSLTIKADKSDRIFEAYQIFTGNPSGNTLGNVEWGASVYDTTVASNYDYRTGLIGAINGSGALTSAIATDANAATVAGALEGLSAENQSKVAKAIGAYLTGSSVSPQKLTRTGADLTYSEDSHGYSFYGDGASASLNGGYYLVVDVNPSPAGSTADDRNYSEFIVHVSGNTAIDNKADSNKPSVSKKVTSGKTSDGTTAVDTTTNDLEVAGLGEYRQFTITINNFQDLSAYQEYGVDYEFYVYDLMTTGLELVEDNTNMPVVVTLKAASGSSTADKTIGSTTSDTDAYYTLNKASGTASENNPSFTLSFTNLESVGASYSGGSMVITYWVHVVPGATPSDGKIEYTNKAWMKHSDDPKNPSDYRDVPGSNESTEKLVSTGVQIIKSSTEGYLANAEFTLYDADGNATKLGTYRTVDNVYKRYEDDTHTHTVNGETRTYKGAHCYTDATTVGSTTETNPTENDEVLYFKRAAGSFVMTTPTSPYTGYVGEERAVYKLDGSNYVKLDDVPTDGTAYYYHVTNYSSISSSEYVLYTDNQPSGATYEQKLYPYELEQTPVYVGKAISGYEVGSNYTLTTGADGTVWLYNLTEGTYTLKETNAPSGYNSIDSTTTIKVSYNPDTDTWTYSVTGADVNASQNVYSPKQIGWKKHDSGYLEITVNNTKGSSLPTTGGIGTTIFYVVGGVLVVGAVVLLITKRRMSASE